MDHVAVRGAVVAFEQAGRGDLDLVLVHGQVHSMLTVAGARPGDTDLPFRS